MKTSKSQARTLGLVIGTAFVATTLSPLASAAAGDQSPFGLQTLGDGYALLAQAGTTKADTKVEDGKCGEGKCGGEMKAEPAKNKVKAKAKAPGKTREASCGSDKKKDAACGAEKKK